MTTSQSLSTAYTIGSVVLTSSVAFVCLIAVGWDEKKLRERIPLMIAVTCGVLFGEAAFHLIPEAVKRGIPIVTTAELVLLGIGLSFGLDLLCRVFLKQSELAPVARISLLTESVHNAMDGAIIAAAYMTDIRGGILATVAILIHEIPHEVGNFSVLVHGGYGRRKAFLLNLLSAGAAVLGAAAVMVAGQWLGAYSKYVLPPSAGGFLYIALFSLLPDVCRTANRGQRFVLAYGTTVGAAFMFMVALAN